MCLKKWVKYTFSTKEAYERMANMVETEYGNYLPIGFIRVIKGYRNRGVEIKKNRYTWSYDMLKEQLDLSFSPFKKLDTYYFVSWEKWFQAKELVKNEKDVFGEVEIEVQ